jgi:hypothetical protein
MFLVAPDWVRFALTAENPGERPIGLVAGIPQWRPVLPTTFPRTRPSTGPLVGVARYDGPPSSD